ncbi:MAG: ankyrin repeat domain-containing protein [Acidobacteriota bacterium]
MRKIVLLVIIVSWIIISSLFLSIVQAQEIERFPPMHEKENLLLLAAQEGNLKSVLDLLAAGAPVNTQDEYQRTPLLLALEYHNAYTDYHPNHSEMVAKLVKILVTAGADVNAREVRFGRTALMWAAYNQDLESIKALLAAGADVNAGNLDTINYGKTTLMEAVENTEAVRILLAAGASVNAHNAVGETALMLAAAAGKQDTVKLLLASGAYVNTKTVNGETALILTIQNSNAGEDERQAENYQITLKTLLAAGANVNALDERLGITALTWAVLQNRIDLLQALIEAGADINAKNTNNGHISDHIQEKFPATALIAAVIRGESGIVKALIEAGADLNGKDSKYGMTPLMYAVEEDQLEVVKLLVKSGAKVNIKDRSGRTALMRAVAADRQDIVKVLLYNGANPKIRSNRGKTALYFANENGYDDKDEILRLLKAASLNMTAP